MTDPILHLDHVSKRYGSGAAEVLALQDVDFSVNPGELVALIGPSGSGKSTMLSIAGALLPPTSGSVWLGKDDVAHATDAGRTELRRSRIGFIFQASNLVSFLTGRQQLAYMGTLQGLSTDESNARADALLEQLGMEHRRSHLPSQMSGGERQRIAIGRALMNEPELILADEPTASLDSARGRLVVEILAGQVRQRNSGGVLVTHDERLIDVCDRVVRIADGRLEA